MSTKLKINRKFLATAGIASVAALVALSPALGADTDILDESCDMVWTIKKWLFRVVYILGAIGLVVIAVSAFLGRFKFSHLISLGGGLFIVAAADALISFLGGDELSCEY